MNQWERDTPADLEEVREALDINGAVPILRIDARCAEHARNAFVVLLETVLVRLRRQPVAAAR